jgi:hypothetical protein
MSLAARVAGRWMTPDIRQPLLRRSHSCIHAVACPSPCGPTCGCSKLFQTIFRTTEGVSQQIYSLPRWPLGYPSNKERVLCGSSPELSTPCDVLRRAQGEFSADIGGDVSPTARRACRPVAPCPWTTSATALPVTATAAHCRHAAPMRAPAWVSHPDCPAPQTPSRSW